MFLQNFLGAGIPHGDQAVLVPAKSALMMSEKIHFLTTVTPPRPIIWVQAWIWVGSEWHVKTGNVVIDFEAY